LEITFNAAKRAETLRERGIDFADADKVFAGRTATRQDNRKNYGEARYITAGFLQRRFVIVVWTPRGSARHVISMRYGHAKEERNWRDALG
jgi:uncharacterized DUF497 family protein